MVNLVLVKVKADECIPIDDDFDKAATYLASTPFGFSKETHQLNLKQRYAGNTENEPYIHPLVYLLMMHRLEHRKLLLQHLTPREEEMHALLTLAQRAIEHNLTDGIDLKVLEEIIHQAQIVK